MRLPRFIRETLTKSVGRPKPVILTRIWLRISVFHRPHRKSGGFVHAFLSGFAFLLAAIVVSSGITGCGSSNAIVEPSGGNTYAGSTFAGKALAGTQPLTGASVQLYAAGTSGNGSSATALLSSPLTTSANGAFTVPAGYACPLATSQLYLVVRKSPSIALLTVLGACSQIAASSQIVVNEATTVAATYALSQFLSAGGNLGASPTNSVGFANAVATALALADIRAGTSPGPTFAANATSPAPRINSIANLLNTCVVAVSGGSPCTALFSATTPAGSAAAPTNTLDALLDLVRHPGANVANLYTLSLASSAFAPALAATPSDWTLFINYTGGGMNGPTGLGIDASGNVWVASYFNVASLFSPLGKPLQSQGVTGFGLSASYGLAIDANNNAWIPNEPSLTAAGNSVTVLNSSGQSVAGTGGFTNGGIDFPISVAIDTDSSAWVVDYGDSHLTHLSSSGQALSGTSGYTSPLLAFPVAVAVDGSHNAWVANQSGGSVTKIAPDGSQFTNYACCDGPSSLAFDQLGNVWVANYYGNSVSEVSSSGAIVSNGSYTGGGIDQPQGIAIDGAGNVWTTNYRGSSISEFAGASGATPPGTALSPSSGFGADAALLEGFAVAIDASGNVWISNFGSNILTQFVGLASPIRTPSIGLPAAP
jgi:streptogramin lyase